MSETARRTGGTGVPASVVAAARLTWLMVGLAGLTAVLSWLFRDALVLAWAARNSQARALVEDGGLQALQESAITVPAFVPLAFSLFAVLAGLALVLVAFFRTGHNWARWSIAGLVVFAGFSTLISVLRGLPLVFGVLAVISLGVNLALLFFLFHKDTNTYLREA